MDCTSAQLNFKVGNFVLSFPNNIHFEIYNVPENYYGIIFYASNKDKYEVLECKLGTRLLINSKTQGINDIPFHRGTCDFLPDFVKIKG